MVLDSLCSVVPPKMVPTITKKETTKEARDTITTMRVGDDHMKKATTQQLRLMFNLTTFDDGETVEDYELRLSGKAAHLTTLDEEVKDGEDASIPVASLQADHDHNQDITRCVDYICCRSDRAVEGGGGGIRGSVDVIVAGREVVPHQGGVGRAEEETQGGEPLRQRRKTWQRRQRPWAWWLFMKRAIEQAHWR
jgi:hypothetical protein